MSKTKALTETGEKPKFVFADYQDNTGPVDTSRVDDFLTDEFDNNMWQLAWIRHDGLEKAQRRYYEVVRRDTHGHLFKDEAFDSVQNIIGRGREHLHPTMGGIPEVYLCIRPREAGVQEQLQMSRASGRRLQDNEEIQGIRDKIGSVVGPEHLTGGFSMNRSGWGND